MVASIRTIGGFLKYVASIEPGKDINNGRRGSEENVKMKFVVPLLEYLGFDRLKDMDFEMGGPDVGLTVDGKLSLIVECKAWEELPDDHLRQCQEYSLMNKAPYVLVAAGSRNGLYSSLVDHSDVRKGLPIVEFTHADLKGPTRIAILRRLSELIGMKSLREGRVGIEASRAVPVAARNKSRRGREAVLTEVRAICETAYCGENDGGDVSRASGKAATGAHALEA